MTFENFTKKVEKALRDYFSEDVRITLQKFTKNNGVRLTGLVFMEEGKNVAATIYLEGMYEEYENGTTMAEVVHRIIRGYEDNRDRQIINLDFFRDYSKVKTRLSCRVINLEKNVEYLANVPHFVFLDLAVVPCCMLLGDEAGCGCIMINREHLDAWKIGEEELLRDAKENMERILPPEVASMEAFMFRSVRRALDEQIGDELQEGLDADEEEREGILDEIAGFLTDRRGGKKMYIVSNIQNFYGAGVMLYSRLFEVLAAKEGCSFFILPSSVHEIILLADTGKEKKEDLYGVVAEVNRQHVQEEEFLSDTVYYYDKTNGEIRIL